MLDVDDVLTIASKQDEMIILTYVALMFQALKNLPAGKINMDEILKVPASPSPNVGSSALNQVNSASDSQKPVPNFPASQTSRPAQDKCGKCGLELEGETIQAVGKQFHKACFGCYTCNRSLTTKCLNVFGNPYCEGTTHNILLFNLKISKIKKQ